MFISVERLVSQLSVLRICMHAVLLIILSPCTFSYPFTKVAMHLYIYVFMPDGLCKRTCEKVPMPDQQKLLLETGSCKPMMAEKESTQALC